MFLTFFYCFSAYSMHSHYKHRYPLHAAVRNGDLGTVQELLKLQRYDINELDSYDYTPLYTIPYAYCFSKSENDQLKLDLLQELLKHNANPNILIKTNFTEIRTFTSLHRAVMYKDSLNIVQLLIAYKADVNIQNNYGMTPVFCGVTYGCDKDIFQSLLQAGYTMSLKDNKGHTVLHALAYTERLDLAEEFFNFYEPKNVIKTLLLIRACTTSLLHRSRLPKVLLSLIIDRTYPHFKFLRSYNHPYVLSLKDNDQKTAYDIVCAKVYHCTWIENFYKQHSYRKPLVSTEKLTPQERQRLKELLRVRI